MLMNLKSLEIKAIDILKTSTVSKPIYKALKSNQNARKFKVDSINRFTPEKTDFSELRFNLILPTLRKTRVFAGISSALSFFQSITQGNDNCRIIIIGDEQYDTKMTYPVPGYKHNVLAKKQLLFAHDSNKVDIGINDIFIFTSWKTAFSFEPIITWQKNKFKIPNRKAIYLIQDFEPGFFSWSSEYVLAESTYSDNPNDIIAVFNSEELYNYFKENNYKFSFSYYFKPALNDRLKKKLLDRDLTKQTTRKKRILIYGRPSEDRNAFEIIRYSLSCWSKQYPNAKDWEIISLGEGFSDIDLQNNRIISKGKVTLDEYAEYMFSAYAAVSLMVSPHPSYPPLEMSTFGVRTITNKFVGKDLSSFNHNIISIDKCSPKLIVETLSRICDEFDSYEPEMSLNEEYINGNGIKEVANTARAKVLES